MNPYYLWKACILSLSQLFYFGCKKLQNLLIAFNFNKLNRLSLSIVCITAVIVSIDGCKKSSPDPLINNTNAVSTNNKALASENDSLVLTPFGYKKKSQVHFLPPDHKLDESNGRLLEKDLKTNLTIHDFGKIDLSGATNSNSVNGFNAMQRKIVPGVYNGWVTDADWYNSSTTDAIAKFTTNWVVPNAPVNNNGQTIFFFNGMQDGRTSSSHILQPVLQWGPSGAGGGNYWAITNWYVSNQQSFYGTLSTVSSGVSLQGVMTMTAQNGNLYSYSSVFTGAPSNTSIQVTNVPQLTWAFETLEAYNVQYPLDYPMSYEVPMTNIQILLHSGTNVPISWGVENNQTDIGQHTTVINSGEVDIYIRNHYIMPITVTMPSNPNLHAVNVVITPAFSGYPGANLNFYSTSTQNYTTYNSSDTYNIQVTTLTQRCHVTLNGQTQDTQGGHTYASFNNIVLSSGGAPLQISVTPF